ncbi:MAG: helix-turn-helix transcriptional regulator [Betaproteobacteria bacterium]|nr:helix-turn-helix transcriptional regulator [Betaproteobacteria bacterium]
MAFVITNQQQLGPTFLKGLRKQKGLTQIQMAKQSGLGQKPSRYWKPNLGAAASIASYAICLRSTSP